MEGNGPCLDTVRALHQTVVSLRAALDKSRSEILELKDKAWPLESVESALRALSIENHVLRRKILENGVQEKDEVKQTKHVTIASPPAIDDSKKGGALNRTRSLENLVVKRLTVSKTISYSNISALPSDQPIMEKPKPEVKQNSTENEHPTITITQQPRSSVDNADLDQDQEVDDIELIFTTDDTKDSDFKEQLVSIDTTEENKHSNVELDVSDRELEDDVFKDNSRHPSFDSKRNEDGQMCASRSDNSINHEEKSLKSCYSYQDSSFENKSIEKDESFDRFEERIRIIETDISKIGIQDVDYTSGRRNTCPNPLQYRPIVHREAIKGIATRKMRPILAHSNAIRRDSGAQTDISAIPGSSWRSESSLANKVRLKVV